MDTAIAFSASLLVVALIARLLYLGAKALKFSRGWRYAAPPLVLYAVAGPGGPLMLLAVTLVGVTFFVAYQREKRKV